MSARAVGWRLPLHVARVTVQPDPAATGFVVAAGGLLAGDASTDRAFRLSLPEGRSTPLPHLGVPVHDAAAGEFHGRPAVFGGGNSSEQSGVQVLRGSRWRTEAHLPTSRSDLSVVRAGGRTLVLGGYDGAGQPRSVLVERNGRLIEAGRLREGVRYAAATSAGGAVYVFGGEVNDTEMSAVQRLDVTTGRTRVVARLPRALGHASAATVGGRILVMGGRTSPDRQTSRMWWFDPASRRFAPAGRLPLPLSDAGVATVGGAVWLLGGETDGDRILDRVVSVRTR